MVATLLRLKLTLLKNGWKRSTVQLVFSIIGIVVALGCVPGLFLLAWLASGASNADIAWVAGIVTVIGSALVLGWFIMPLLFFGVDPTLDPQRFAIYNVPRRSLMTGLLASGFIGIPGVMTVFFALATAVVWLRRPEAIVPALVGGLLAAMTAIALSRLGTTAAAGALASRRGRDLTATVSVLAIVAVSFAFSAASNFGAYFAEDGVNITSSQLTETLHSITSWLAWTPFGAGWALPADAAAGAWGILALRLVAAVAWLLGIVWLWSLAVSAAMVRSPASSGESKAREGNAVLTMASRSFTHPRTQGAAAVTARCLRYWRSDPRYLTSAVTLIIMPLLFIGMGFIPAMPKEMAIGGPIMVAYISGFMIVNDVAMDSTAFWLHVHSALRGWADRAGRALAMAIWTVPVLVVMCFAALAICGQLAYWPCLLGGTLGLLAAGLAAASVASALGAAPAALPGESPMTQKSGAGAIAMLQFFGSTLAAFILSLPAVVPAVLGVFVAQWWGWVALAVGVIGGAALVWAGCVVGGRILDTRGVQLLASLVKADTKAK